MTEQINVEEIINKKSETLSDKVNHIFDRIDFLELTWEDKQAVAEKVKNDAQSDKLYWIEVFLSSAIAALWLLQNSVAVVIGAMLIAPFLRPINGLAFAVARWEKHFFWNMIRILVISMGLSIFMWYISVKITGLTNETSEILSRTSPNIIDLFIAIFSAIVAVLSLGYHRLSESVAWVAMSAALLPPLWVVWIELALWEYSLAWWAIMLFLANFVAIILVGTILFWLYGFTPHTWKNQTSSVKSLAFIIIIFITISIPLVWSLISINQRYVVAVKSESYLENIFHQETSNFTIDKLEIVWLSKNKVSLQAVIKIPEWLNFYNTFKQQIETELSQQLWKNIEIDIQLIRVASIVSKEE